jgi:hypothetical protein
MVAIQKTKKRIRVINPQKKKRNPLITLGATNPNKKGNKMPKAKKTRAPAKKQNGKKHRRRNPVNINYTPRAQNAAAPFHAKKRKKNRSHNPLNFLGTSKQLIESGAFALTGLIAARQIPQLLLNANNVGWKGYLANAATAIAASYAAGKLAGPQAGGDVLVGGGLYLVNRIITEQFSPIGKAFTLSGTGDAAASSTMGRVRVGYFPLPVQRDKSGNPIIPQAIIDAVKAQLPAPAPSKVSGLSRHMAGRFSRAA